MADSQNFDLVVIGAGPGGYVAAIRAAQLGMNVACVEKESTLGGTCLNVGCIPSKALLESSELYAQAKEKFQDHGIGLKDLSIDMKKFIDRKDKVVKQLTGGIAGLFKKNKITSIFGTAQVGRDRSVSVTTKDGVVQLLAKHVIIATGSQPIAIPGVEMDGKTIIDSTGALNLSEVPGTMVVIGGGVIGLELGSVYARLGSKIIVLEALDRIAPSLDVEVGKTFQRILSKQGMEFHLSTKVKKAVSKGNQVEVTVEAEGKESVIVCDKVLVAVGRKPYVTGLGLAEAGIKLDERGRIDVNDHFETSLKGVYAIGDVIKGAMLAHKASEEGVALVEQLAGQAGHVNYHTIPSVVYTWPEVASVGFTEEEAKAKGVDYKVSKFPFLASGRAIAMNEKDGFVKLIADKKTDRLLGAHILGPRASDMIAELVIAMEFGSSAEDIARTCHAHPTLAESVKEAALALGTGAIHI
ncbi:MAG: dihydrolipoyl dehydrogenase [Deltaproteobacteria bacterium]|nr:MAG: dihydrolipoyl dehydrogenase [Deltaproteobacteria bacterium]